MIEKVRTFVNESVIEMKEKVSWPAFSALQSSALLVIVASLVFALMVGLLDVVFEKGMTYFYQTF